MEETKDFTDLFGELWIIAPPLFDP